jgi:subtilisin family serine protease
VAAVNVAAANINGVPGVFDAGDNPPVETFSSDGPRRVFFEPDGTPITPGDFSSTGGEVRQKPDIAAADGVMTATPGFNPFFGTSAAAPHAAAIAALMAELSNLTPSGMKQVFAASALDIEAAGMDRDSGYGIIDAVAAVGTTTPNTPLDCYVNDLSLSDIPNTGPQTFRACKTITAGDGLFNDLTLIAGNGIPGTVTFQPGFTSDGPLSVDITSGP